MSDDLISRQAALEALRKIYQNRPLDSDRWVLTDCEREIDALPSAQPESCKYWDSESNFCALYRPSAQPAPKKGRWIPVSEKLPVIENNLCKRVLVTTSWGLVREAYYCVDHWEINDISYKLTSIVAWMPLPKPYMGGEKE